jgi:UPF0755 protein
VTDPTQPRPRGRHSQADAGASAGRPASELLAAWADADTLQATDDGDALRPRRRRRYAPDTDGVGVGVLSPHGSVDVADVEIAGLAAGGIADVGLTAAGLDLSAFGLDRAEQPHRGTPAAWPWTGDAPAADPDPRTAEMRVVPPAVPQLTADGAAGREAALDRRTAPEPRATAEPSTADRVTADRFHDGDTDPGWLSSTGRRAPGVPVRAAQPPAPEPAPAIGSLASLFTDAPGGGLHPGHPSAPVAELPTEVHSAFGPDDGARDRLPAWGEPVARHRTGTPEDGEHDQPFEHGDAQPADVPGDHRHADHQDDHEHHGLHDDGLHDGHLHDDHAADLDLLDHHLDEPGTVSDHTGGLEVVVPGGGGHDGGAGGGGRGRRGGGRGGRGGADRPRKRRRPVVVVLSLVVLAGLVAGIVIGGQQLWNAINPVAEDYAGTGSGSVDVRVEEGDSLGAIASTLVGADVIASAEPFEDAAKANPAATGIQPGVYSLRLQMSGKAALDLLLDPASRQVTKVTVPEGLTAAQVLQRLADQAGLPLDQLQAAVADPAALGLPPYANGLVEGFLFPATYDIEPGDTAVDVLSEMVAGTVRMLDSLQVPEDQRLSVITEASIVQAEAGSVEDMGMVAQVLDNRLADGMKLQLDTTVNYANGKAGITTTSADRANPSPYNTYMYAGLPPGAIGNPGEEAVRAVLTPTPGDWLFFVVVNPDTGETRFAATDEEHAQNVLLFQQWLQENPGN